MQRRLPPAGGCLVTTTAATPAPPAVPQGKPLLAAKQTESDSRGYVLVPLARGCAVLPKLSVTGGGCYACLGAGWAAGQFCVLPHASTPAHWLHPTGSSEALLSGQRPPFALFARAVEAMEEGAGVQQGQRRAGIAMVVSEGFVVNWRRWRAGHRCHTGLRARW